MDEPASSIPPFNPDLTDKNRKHDRILKVGEKRFYVNKTYVTSWSQYLDVLLNGDFVEQNQTEIEIKQVNSNIFELFLTTIHPGAPCLNYIQCLQLLDLERFLSSEPLNSLCSRRILKLYETGRISASNVLEAISEFQLFSILERLVSLANPRRRMDILLAVDQLQVVSPEIAEEVPKIRLTVPIVGICGDEEYDRDYRC